MEQGEVVEAAAEREVLEESGLEIEATGVLGLYSYEGQIPTIVVFEARVTGGEPRALDETMDVKSFARDELSWSELAFPSTEHRAPSTEHRAPSTEHALKDYLKKS